MALWSVFPLKNVVEVWPKCKLTLCETYYQQGASDFHWLGGVSGGQGRDAKSNCEKDSWCHYHPFFVFSQTKKSKKAGKKVTLAGSSAKAGRRDNFDAFGGGNYNYGDEFDDFM